MSEPVFLNMAEACCVFKCSPGGIMGMLREKQIHGFKVGSGNKGGWRIQHPGPEWLAKYESEKDLDSHISRVPLLTRHEVAEIIGRSPLYVSQLVKEGKLKTHIQGRFGKGARTNFYTVESVRNWLWKKEKRSRQGRRAVKISQVVQWAKTFLDQERAKSAEGYAAKDEMYELLEQMMELPPKERLASLSHFWRQLDLVTAMRTAASVQLPTDEPQESAVPHDPVSGTNRPDDSTVARLS